MLQNSFPTAQEFSTMKELGNMAIKSGFLPTSIKTPEQAVIIMLKGRELGIPPMQAFSSIAVVNGKPTMSAELMLSKIYQNVPGAIVNFISTDANGCSLEAKRPGGKFTKFSFTMQDATRAGLTGKGPWVTYPAAMLRARAISSMARAMFPDALSGVVYTPEELGAEIDDEGEIRDVPRNEPKDVTPQVEPVKEIEAAEEPKDSDPGDFVMNVGKKYYGKKFADIGVHELDGYVQWYIDDLKRRNLNPSANEAKFLRAADEFFESRVVKTETGEP